MDTSHATIPVVNEQPMDITNCNICHETLKNPRMLPCIHTFCLKCISQVGKKTNKRAGSMMSCPVCRKEFTIPTSGFEGLQENFFVRRLVEMSKISKTTTDPILCDTCQEKRRDTGRAKIADMQCLQCHLNLCEKCCAHHRKSKLTKGHTLLKGTRQSNTFESAKLTESKVMCEKHHEEELKLYCYSCNEVLCSMCFIQSHQGHDWLRVSDAATDFLKQLQSSINDLDDCTLKTETMKDTLEFEKDKVAKRTRQLQKQVIRRRDYWIELINKHANLLLEELQTRERGRLKEIAIRQEDIERHLVSLESCMHYFSSVILQGTDLELCLTVNDLKARAAELHSENDTTDQRLLTPSHTSFTATIYDEFGTNLIGKFEDTDNEDLDIDEGEDSMQENVEESFETRCSLEQNIPGNRTFRPKAVLVQALKTKQQGKPIWGLTVMDGELFVVIGKSSQIEVYDSLSYKFKRQWKVLQALTDPQDIISCASKKCLLIMNWGDEHNPSMILKVNPTGIMLIIWPLRFNGGLISITQESTVIVTSYGSNHLYEYSVDGELIKEIKIPKNSLYHPQHTLKLANGRFIVCCGASTDSLNRVCLIDQRGNVLKSFGGERGSDNQSLIRPLHLAVDGDRYIFVADWNNRRVLLLNSDLDFQMEFLTRTAGLRHPGRIILDQSNNRLLLAENASGMGPGQVLIFDI